VAHALLVVVLGVVVALTLFDLCGDHVSLPSARSTKCLLICAVNAKRTCQAAGSSVRVSECAVEIVWRKNEMLYGYQTRNERRRKKKTTNLISTPPPPPSLLLRDTMLEVVMGDKGNIKRGGVCTHALLASASTLCSGVVGYTPERYCVPRSFP
jgi:Tfp pilus assembly protein PilX